MKKNKLNVLLVIGGNSKEREVSLDSGEACFKALKRLGFSVKKFDPLKENFNEIRNKNVDIIFNSLHGKGGEDGFAQSYFEYLKIPYTHSGVLSSMNAMDKVTSKEIFSKNKILTPNFFLINKKIININKIIKLMKIKKIKFPVVIKPVNEGSSIGVKICNNSKKLKAEGNLLLNKYSKLILEQFIGGQEIQVAVMNNKALGAIELKPKRYFYDYKAKYTKSAQTIHIMPAKVNKSDYQKVLKISEKTHKVLKCRGVTRSDFKFYRGKFYILEINTQPGMTNLSLVPEIARYKGITFDDLVYKITKDASINK